MHPLENDHLENLDEPDTDTVFNKIYVDQVEKAMSSVFDEICRETNVKDYQSIRSQYLMSKRNVTKEKLCEWLETVCCILDRFSLPWLHNAASLTEELPKLKDEKISDQKTIIDLQKQLIEKGEEQIKSFQSTVQTEMKSYASAVTKSCTAALAPKKIQDAVQRAAVKEERNKNVIVYGIAETDNEQLQSKIDEVLIEIGEKPQIKEITRVGLKKESLTRPVKLTLKSSDHVSQVLRNARKLRTKEGFSSVYLCQDRTIEERRAFRMLVDELKQKRTTEPDKFHQIRNNKVVSVSKNGEPAQTGKT